MTPLSLQKDNSGSGDKRSCKPFAGRNEDLHRQDNQRRKDLSSKIHRLALSVICGDPLYHEPLKKNEEVLLQLYPRGDVTCLLMCGTPVVLIRQHPHYVTTQHL
jgi:hypothetical protein